MANEENLRKRPSELTLEELTAKEHERLEIRKAKTDEFIKRINGRIDAAKAINNVRETERLNTLLERHKARKEELKNVKPTDRAKERFDRYQERENRHK